MVGSHQHNSLIIERSIRLFEPHVNRSISIKQSQAEKLRQIYYNRESFVIQEARPLSAAVSKPCEALARTVHARRPCRPLCTRTRKPSLPPLPPALVDRMVGLRLTEAAGKATHRAGRMAAAIRRVAALGAAKPGRSPPPGPTVRHFKLSQATEPMNRGRPEPATHKASRVAQPHFL
jgi:hypothetical protein